MYYDKLNVHMWIVTGLLSLTADCATALRHRRRSDEELLLEYLFRDYNPSARPVLNSSQTVSVNVQFSLLQIQELNIRSQVLTTTGLLILDWKDERLTWDKEISDLTEIVIDGSALWKPEFAIINGAETIYESYNEFQAVLRPDGSLRWEPGGIFKTMCQIDITYYPFDEQKCDLTFGAWSYYTSKMNMTTSKDEINKDTYEKNGEWQVLNTKVLRSEFFFACCPDQRFAFVKFYIYIKRKHTFYIMNVILPGILTSAVLLSIFFCTPSQKVHIGVAALLSFRLFLLNVADTIPRTSDHVPLLGIYLSCTMAITTMAMVTTVFVLNLYSMREKPVPPWAKKVFIVYTARILCMCNCQTSPESRAAASRDRPTIRASGIDADDISDLAEDDQFTRGTYAKVRGVPNGRRVSGPTGGKGSGGGWGNTKADYSKDWVHVATVCDRLFFWVCLLFIVVTTLVLFHPLITARYFEVPALDATG